MPWCESSRGAPTTARSLAWLLSCLMALHIVFFECAFRVEVRARALHVDVAAVRECAPLPLDGLGGAYLAGLTKAPLGALG
jgi:hypothetical protein